MRLAAAFAILLVACASPAARSIETPTQSMSAGSTARAFLECIGRSGAECVSPSPAGDAWAALGELERVDATPTPMLPAQLITAARALGGRAGYRKLLEETLRAAAQSKDLSCRVTHVEEVGPALIARRDMLLKSAELLGLGSTRAGPPTGRIAAAVTPIHGSWLATAQCDTGRVFVLVAPPRVAIDADEDPRANPGAGWHAYAASIDRARLLRGGHIPLAPAPPLRDPRGTGLDPWIPLSELEL